MSIFEYDKEEEEQKLQATYEKIGEKRGEKQGELKKAKSIAISLAHTGDVVEVEMPAGIMKYKVLEIQRNV